MYPDKFRGNCKWSLQTENQEAHPLTKGRPYTCAGSLKGGRADWLVEKCTELGASALQPLLTERSPSVGERIERWERVTLAATKQCQRLHEMALREPLTVQQLLPIVSKAVRLGLLGVQSSTAICIVVAEQFYGLLAEQYYSLCAKQFTCPGLIRPYEVN